MDYTQLPRTIKLPYWTNDQKDQVVCQFHYEGGPISTVSVSDTEAVSYTHLRAHETR